MQINIYKHEQVYTIHTHTQIGKIKIVEDKYESLVY